MKKILFSFFGLIFLCCNNQDAQKNNPDKNDSIQMKQLTVKNSLILREDTLTDEERLFLNKISHENEFLILSNRVQRYFSVNDSSLTISKLLFSKELLDSKGYVFLELKFYGNISEPNIYYTYSLGQAAYGFGSIVGRDTSDYVHILKSCGLTTCITQSFKDGTKIFEKSE
jgi:hypothetical protein